MNETVQIALALSGIFNALFLAIVIIFAAQKGGVPYLLDKIAFLLGKETKLVPMTDNPYYIDKTQHFSTLSITNSDIVFLGDSLTDYCEWAELLEDTRIKNRGISGDRTDGILPRIDEILAGKPQKLFLTIGINDLVQGRAVSDLIENYRLILDKIRDNPPERVFVCSVLPINNQKSASKLNIKLNNQKVLAANAQLQELARNYSYQYIDLFSAFSDENNELDPQYTTDGVHLNGKAYLHWQGIVEKNVVN
jgi:lysophospholipase L1-like esterase